MASLRNLAIGILGARGHRNIAAALRRNARGATRLLPLLGITSHEPDTPALAEALPAGWRRSHAMRKPARCAFTRPTARRW
jgi:hypothetical protein